MPHKFHLYLIFIEKITKYSFYIFYGFNVWMFAHECCIFTLAFGCCTLLTLVKIFFSFHPSRLHFLWHGQIHLSPSVGGEGGIPLSGRGMVGKNRSAQSKTTVRSKRVFPLKVWRGPLHCVPQCRIVLFFPVWS